MPSPDHAAEARALSAGNPSTHPEAFGRSSYFSLGISPASRWFRSHVFPPRQRGRMGECRRPRQIGINHAAAREEAYDSDALNAMVLPDMILSHWEEGPDLTARRGRRD